MRHCPSIGIGIGLGIGLNLGPSGPPYVTEGLVLDYSTVVGPFTIVDQSPENNDATLYTGRGVKLDAVDDTITYVTAYSSASRTATVWMRVTGLGVRTLSGATGSFTFTPTGTNTWEQLSSTATVTGNLSWTAGSDCDVSDLIVADEHWTHSEWSTTAANSLNGFDILDSGPNQLHGSCTGCAGFTAEASIPQTADRNWNRYDWNAGTPILSDTGTMLVSESDANNQIDALGESILEPRRNTQQLNIFGQGERSVTLDAATLDLTTAATWELWGNFYLTAPTTAEREIFTKGGTCWNISLPGSGFGVGGLYFRTDDGTGAANRVFTMPDRVACHTFVLESGVISQYTDGVLIGTGFTGSVKSPLANTTNNITIGANITGAVPFPGEIGSAKIYNRALDATEVLANYNGQKSIYAGFYLQTGDAFFYAQPDAESLYVHF